MTPASLPFVQLDVFSSQRFEGNPLAVFPDGRGLTDSQMQAIAREMNLSETTFILPEAPEVEKQNGVRVRIFTVQEELPFAGHPTLGTAFVLRGTTGTPEIALHLKAGKITVRFEENAGKPVFGEMTQLDPQFGATHDREAVAQATGLKVADMDASLPIQSVSTGVLFAIVPLRSLEVLRRLEVTLGPSVEYLAKSGGKFFYFVTREAYDPAVRLQARMLFYNGEDPATGSAAGCTAAWMVAYGVAKADERVVIEQGAEMLRPSRIFVRASRVDGRVVNVRVGGNCAEVARGEIFL